LNPAHNNAEQSVLFWQVFALPMLPETGVGSLVAARQCHNRSVNQHQEVHVLGYASGQELDSQALAAFGTTCVDHRTATTGFHANQKTVGTGTTDFGGLISAFHLEFLTGSIWIHPRSTGAYKGRSRSNRPEHNQGNRRLSQIF
jgi:hypothetical protein